MGQLSKNIQNMLPPDAELDRIWDLEPHKGNIFGPDDVYVYKCTMEGLQGLSFSSVSIDEAMQSTIENGGGTIQLNPGTYSIHNLSNQFSIHDSPEKFQHVCLSCNVKIESFQEIICDKCLNKQQESIYLEGEDPRYGQLILGEEE